MVNPCSFAALETVLDNILKMCAQKWIVVGCDGLPFMLCHKMIDNYFICPTCHELFRKKTLFENHITVHPVDDIYQCKKYGKILLIPGLGHFEINLTKAMFKLLWNVVLKSLAVMLGWKSLKALTACEKCTDHHKAWQILSILFDSGCKAVLRPYVRKCKCENTVPSVSGLFKYYVDQTPNYIFMFKCIFTFLYALNLFRSSVRRGNFRLMSVALHKLSNLFYGLNMTTYMDINIRYENMLKQAPPEVMQFVSENIMCSQSGHQSKAEGGDFILESVNKKIKTAMPSGLPTDDRWLRVCRNLPFIEKLKKHLENKLGQSEDQSGNTYFRQINNEEAVKELEKKLEAYLQEDQLKSIDGKPLDHELSEFDDKCETNKKKYYETYLTGINKNIERVFVTPDDRANFFDISKKRNTEIQECIEGIIQNIEEEGGFEESEVLHKQYMKEIKGAAKKVLLSFYREVVQCLEEVSSREIEGDCI